ncbi:hypothetical protein CCHOA_10460 [Corynebacterium choanae]|uniref:Uncharacterized protein n=1 Tax=Corynebacterium choanae TaxID=1862358 RepID=A0A3G6J8N2_9CORY|nr:hypothetical protein CCHOA_10460 [Corynebacterium choanae]
MGGCPRRQRLSTIADVAEVGGNGDWWQAALAGGLNVLGGGRVVHVADLVAVENKGGH